MTLSAEQVPAVLSEAERLYDRAAVEAALDTMARRVTEMLAAQDPLLLCVMNGGLVITGQLLTRLEFPLQVDYLHVSRYRGLTRGGETVWHREPVLTVKSRVVLVVDDILDEGETLADVLRYCRALGARRVLSAVLVRKHQQRRPRVVEADFVGLEVGDRYVFGYGMDYQERLRNVAGIYALKNT